MQSIKYKHNLELNLQVNKFGQTFCQHQYTTYPLRLSPIFRLEESNRAYLYLINTSPGLLSGDTLNLSLQLAANSNLYLTDQAATKVHPMLDSNKAMINNQIILDAGANLELVPEPIILYQKSILEQNTTIKLHSTARLFLTEIILPGRLAKNEYYDFDYYFNRTQISDLNNKFLFIDATHLSGNNPFKNNKLFASLPIIGNAIAIVPDTNLNLLIDTIENQTSNHNLESAISILPAENGIIIRALANKTRIIKKHFIDILNCIRAITNQSLLPHIPK